MTHLVHAVGYTVSISQLVHTWRPAGIVAVTAGDADRVSRGDHPGTFHHSGIDRLHKGNVGEADRPHVADGGKTGQQCFPGVHRASERRVRRQLGDRPGYPVSRDVEGQMGVGVNQSGEEGQVAQLDGLGVGRKFRGADALNLPVGNDDDSGRDQLASDHIEHAGRPHDGGLLGRGHTGCTEAAEDETGR